MKISNSGKNKYDCPRCGGFPDRGDFCAPCEKKEKADLEKEKLPARTENLKSFQKKVRFYSRIAEKVFDIFHADLIANGRNVWEMTIPLRDAYSECICKIADVAEAALNTHTRNPQYTTDIKKGWVDAHWDLCVYSFEARVEFFNKMNQVSQDLDPDGCGLCRHDLRQIWEMEGYESYGDDFAFLEEELEGEGADEDCEDYNY
jgi:hypothetical protein